MNILSFDIEEWAIAKAGGYGSGKRYAEYDDYLEKILNALDSRQIKATFFCTGMMAEGFPEVIKRIQGGGHEIGCHSHRHSWMNKMSISEARDDTYRAVTALEQCTGQKVLSYRAPAFSIGESNKWMFEILAENGITCDSSVFPAARDLGGFPRFGAKIPCLIEHNGIQLREFPICTTRIMGKELAYTGGGYFRFFPYGFIKSRMDKADYAMCYFHIGDLVPETSGILSRTDYEAYYKEPGTLKNRYIRHFKSNYGKRGTWRKLERIINAIPFVSIDQAVLTLDTDTIPRLTV